jgi:hypothetical protein
MTTSGMHLMVGLHSWCALLWLVTETRLTCRHGCAKCAEEVLKYVLTTHCVVRMLFGQVVYDVGISC